MQRLGSWLGDSLLEIYACKLISNLGLTELLKASVSLTCLILCDIQYGLAGSIVSEAGRSCLRLSELRLIRCQSELTDDSLRSLLAGCPSLSLLELRSGEFSHTINWSNQQLLVDLVGCLSCLLFETENWPADFPGHFLRDLPKCPLLTSLSFPVAEFSELLLLLSLLPNLKDLKLKCGCTFRINGDLRQLTALPQLSSLRLECSFKTVSSIALLLICFPNLDIFSLDNCAPTGVSISATRAIVRALPAGLTCLGLRFYCCNWDNLGMTEAAEPPPLGLQQLELSLFDGQVSGLRLMSPLVNCSGLTHLSLDVCSDELLPAVLSQLPRLRCLRLTNCSGLTPQAWASLRHLQSPAACLDEFQALECTTSSLTDEAVADLCASPVAWRLRRLCLFRCLQLTAAALASIASGCPWLSRLALIDCRCIEMTDLRDFRAAYDHYVELRDFLWAHAEFPLS